MQHNETPAERLKNLFDSELGKRILDDWAKQTYMMYGVDHTDPQNLAYHRGAADFVLSILRTLEANNG